MAHREAVLSIVDDAIPPDVALAAAPSAIAAAVRLPWSPAPLVFALPISNDRLTLFPSAADVPPLAALLELCPVGLFRPQLFPTLVPKIDPHP